MLELRLLGDLEVKRGGQPVPLPASKKSRALLAYLAATPGPHLRERLCELFFDGPDDPRAALRWSLTKLRPIAGAHLSCTRDRVEFDAAGAQVDVFSVAVPATATTAALETSAALFRGEFMDGLDLPACFRFEQWRSAERERLRRAHIAILSELLRRLGQSESALPYARRRVVIDPFDEDAHAALIRLLAALGLNQDAMRQYDQCRAIFERELATRPTAVLEDARRTIGKQARPVPQAKSSGEPAVAQPEFVGRDKELGQIAQAVGPVLILGEPGIGKSRLLEESRARVTGTIAYGRAFAAEMVRPYGIWIDALSSVGADFPAESNRERLFDAVAAVVGALDGVFVDDIQWIDEASAALLHFLVRSGSAVRLVCAARTGEIADNPHASRLVRDMARETRLTRIELSALTAAETKRLVASSHDADRVAAESRGNPLFAIELARSNSRGALGAVIADRLAQLDPSAADLVAWAAALGQRFDAEILGRATALPSGQMLAALEKLERHAILRAAEDGSYDFAHDLIRDAAYQMISTPRRTLIHRHIAGALQASHDPDHVLAGQILHHASLAGDPSTAAAAAVAAGERCLRLFAYAEAVSVGRRGLQIAEVLPADERVETQLRLMHVIVMSRTPIGERLPFAGAISELVEEGRRLGLAKSAALGAHLLACLHQESNDYRAAADATVRSAEIGRSADRVTAARAIANTARCLIFLERDIERAASLLTESASSGIEDVELSLGLGYWHAHQGRSSEAARELESALKLAAHVQDHWREWVALARLVTLALEDRQPELALQHCQRLHRVAAKMSGGSEPVRTEAFTTVAAYAAGHDVHLEPLLERLREIDSKADLAWVLAYLAEIELERGEFARAQKHAQEAMTAAQAVGRASDAVIAASILGKRLKVKNPRDLSARAKRHRKEGPHGDTGAGANVRSTVDA